ncbi:MAG: hypothetical protein IH623_08565 [Verrucomicrobia bacterium]|nr:hypothetical protein [Verrucomicrobiota bacterium]
MKFIARYLNLIGLLLLASFVTAAAGLYFQVPERLQAKRGQATVAAAKQADNMAPSDAGCCAAKAPAPEPPPAATCPHLAAQAAKESSCCPQPANP